MPVELYGSIQDENTAVVNVPPRNDACEGLWQVISWRSTGAVKASTRIASCGNAEYTRALSVPGPCPK